MEVSKVLFTGSNGFLGRALQKGLPLFSLVDINELQGSKVDISQPFEFPKGSYFDYVIHVAGKAHSVPKNKSEAHDFFSVNFEGTKNLIAAIDKLGARPKSFIFISTVSVYGKEAGLNINEQSPLLGTTPYAKSKILAENFLLDWSTKNNIKLGILRLPLLAGPNPPGNLGSMLNGIKSGRYFNIGSGEAKKSIVWAEDISTIIPSLLILGGVFNLTDGYNPSFKELASAIAKSLGKPSPKSIPLVVARLLASIGDLIGEKSPINSSKLQKLSTSLTFDDSKARRLLNWKPSSVTEKLRNSSL